MLPVCFLDHSFLCFLDLKFFTFPPLDVVHNQLCPKSPRTLLQVTQLIYTSKGCGFRTDERVFGNKKI